MNTETTSTKGPLRVFVSYRREDSPGHAGRLYDTLSARLPRAELFMDVDNIEPGVDFVETINAAVGSCDVLLALMGPRWGSVTRNGSRRLEEPGDFVRLELEAALRRNVRVIPVLFMDAAMPRAEELPASLQTLARRNAIHIADDRWRTDADRLVAALAKYAPASEPVGRDGLRAIGTHHAGDAADAGEIHRGSEGPDMSGRAGARPRIRPGVLLLVFIAIVLLIVIGVALETVLFS